MKVDVHCKSCGQRARLDVGAPAAGQPLDEYLHLVREERRQCAWQATEAFKIPGGRLLHVVPKRMHEQTVAMQVKLIDRRRPLVDTDFRLQNRGVLLFAVDRDVRGVEPLIIVLKAEE